MTPQVSILATWPTIRRKLGRGYADKRSRPGRLGMTACALRDEMISAVLFSLAYQFFILNFEF